MFAYAGIGSRETPASILNQMFHIGQVLAQQGWILRSGFAGGADMAFFKGANSVPGPMENFIPWRGFNGAPTGSPKFIVPRITPELVALAAKHHPAWDRCSDGAKKLHTRNGCQVLGEHLDDPVKMVICWTPRASGSGGTGQAIRIAKSKGIPVFDLADPGQFEALDEYVTSLMEPINSL